MNPKKDFIVPCSNWAECQEAQECECAPCYNTTSNPDIRKGVTITNVKAIFAFNTMGARKKINTSPSVI